MLFRSMATHNDPIRKLAEQGIVHMPHEQMGLDASESNANARREKLNAPRLGQSPEAQAWEDAADVGMEPMYIRNLHPDYREPWMEKADPKTEIFKATNDMQAHYLGFDHIIDVLKQDLAEGRIRPEKLNTISMEQAVRRVHEYDQERKKAMAETALKATEGMPVHKDYGDGFKWIELAMPESRYTVKGHPKSGEKAYEQLQEALKYEGDTMGHCVGSYCPDVAEGRSRIFSLRDAKNEPHVTIEVRPGMTPEEQAARGMREIGGHLNKILQIKGKANAKPKKNYIPYVQDFVKSGNWSEINDGWNAGLRRYSDVFDDKEQRQIEKAFNNKEPVPDHEWLTGNQIQTLHNSIYPEGKRLQYDIEGNIRKNHASGGSIHPSIDTMKLALIMKASGGGVSLPGFFSPVDQALDTVQSKGTGQQILSQLSKAPNVKPDELKDRGIDAALRARPKITKEELKDMAKAMSAPRIKEIHRHGPSDKEFTIEESPYGGFEVFDEYSMPVKRFFDYYDAKDHADKLMNGDSKYEEYQLPGGKNYRETTLSLDTGKKRPSIKIWEFMDETGRVFSQTDNPQTAERWKQTYPNRVRETDMPSSLNKPQDMFISGHWDEPNVLLHYRTNDRTDANGKKVLFIEELQSDWANEGKKKGFKSNLSSLRAESPEAIAALGSDNISMRVNAPFGINEQNLPLEMRGNDGKKIPFAPFVTSTDKWLNLALKHIIHRAAKEGYDKVAFINGRQSHERFPQKNDGSSTRGAFSSFYGEPTGEVVNDNEEPQKGKSPMLHMALNKLLPKIKGGKLSHVMLPHIRQTAVPMNSPQVGFDITPEMREHINTKGLPLYHSGGLI